MGTIKKEELTKKRRNEETNEETAKKGRRRKEGRREKEERRGRKRKNRTLISSRSRQSLFQKHPNLAIKIIIPLKTHCAKTFNLIIIINNRLQ